MLSTPVSIAPCTVMFDAPLSVAQEHGCRSVP